MTPTSRLAHGLIEALDRIVKQLAPPQDSVRQRIALAFPALEADDVGRLVTLRRRLRIAHKHGTELLNAPRATLLEMESLLARAFGL